MAVELLRRALPLAVVLDERLERAHELAAVLPLPRLDRAEQGVAEQTARLVVLQAEQELERAEVVPRAHPAAVRVGHRPRLERAARLVQRAAGLAGGDRAAGAGGHALAGPGRHPRAHAL